MVQDFEKDRDEYNEEEQTQESQVTEWELEMAEGGMNNEGVVSFDRMVQFGTYQVDLLKVKDNVLLDYTWVIFQEGDCLVC